MASRLNSKTLLPVAVVLIIIKFVLLPIVAWQNDLLSQIERHEQRNAKAQRLLDSEAQLTSRFVSLSESYKEQADQYPRFAAAEDFHIETKIMFDMLLQQNQLKVTQFFWREAVDKEIFPGMYMGRFNVNFSGQFKDFALLQSKLGTSEKAFRIANFSAMVKKQTDKSIGTVEAAFTIEAYYWLGGQ